MISTSPEIQHQYGHKTAIAIAKAATMTISTISTLRIQQKEQYQYQAQISSEGLTRFGNDAIGSVNIARIANAVQVTICLLVSTSVY